MTVKIFYYPDDYGSHLVEIDMQELLGELFSDRQYDVVDGVSMAGGIRRSITGGREFITFQRDNFTAGKELAYQFEALQNHLDRGKSCMIAADLNKMFCFPLLGNHNSSTQTINVGSPVFQNIVGAASIPAVDDYMKIETDIIPVMKTEKVKISGVGSMTSGGGSMSIDKRLQMDYYRRAFIMSEHFFPILKRPADQVGQKMVTAVGDRLFTLNVQLVVDYEVLYAMHPDNGMNYGSSAGIASGLRSLYSGSGNIPNYEILGGFDGLSHEYYDALAVESLLRVVDRILE